MREYAMMQVSPQCVRQWSRGLLAGPVCFAASAAVMAGGVLWIPKGAAQIDNLVLPMVFFPAIWAIVFFYACLDRNLLRAWAVTLGLLLVNAATIAVHLNGAAST